jgi:phage-related protein
MPMGTIIIRISKKNRQHTCQQKKYRGTNNDLQNIQIKLKIDKHELGSVTSFLAPTIYQKHPDRNYTLWNIVSSERYILHMQVLLERC